jgi:hypothetical protein
MNTWVRTPSTTNERGDEIHPAFGRIHASRVSYGGGGHGGAVLFDSDLIHHHTVRVTIERATRNRDLSHDYIHGGKELIEVEMSEAQWASFVSSMNTSGVPCTLLHTSGDRFPGLEYHPRMAESMAEVHGSAAKVFAEAKAAMDAYDALDPKAPAKQRREALNHLRSTLRNSEPNVAFVARSLTEHVENVVQRARADIEAMVSTEAQRLGLTSADRQMLELPSMPVAAGGTDDFEVGAAEAQP